ncbi:MAG: hypothetical protein Q8L52_01295 [bacterium]|nr:hypothetical protein [bacterium]
MEKKPRGRGESLPQSVAEKFNNLYGAELTKVTYGDLPQDVKKHFESQSRKFILPETYHVGNFNKIYKFTHPNGDVTYVGQQDKVYNTNDSTERLTFFADTRDGQMTGYLELRFALTDLNKYFKNKPFVGFSRTNATFLRQGLAKRRLEEANAYSVSEHRLPLNSDSFVTEKARGVWERLMVEGKAEKYKEGDNERFRFVPSK